MIKRPYQTRHLATHSLNAIRGGSFWAKLAAIASTTPTTTIDSKTSATDQWAEAGPA